MTTTNNLDSQSLNDSIYQQKITDILFRKTDIETALNDLKQQQLDYLSKLKNVNLVFSNDTVQRIPTDQSIVSPSFNPTKKTFTIKSYYKSQASFPRFRFKASDENNTIKGEYYKRLKITFRWAGTAQSYDSNNLLNKKWCLTAGGGVAGCRTASYDLPPKSGEYIEYIVTITNQGVLNSNKIDWMGWNGPSYDSAVDKENNPVIFEFKEISYIPDINRFNIRFNNLYNSIKAKINLLNKDIIELKGYDNKNKYLDEWNNLINSSNELNDTYNNLLEIHAQYNAHSEIGSENESTRSFKSKNLEYFSFICLIIFTVIVMFRIMLTSEETFIENIIFILMFFSLIYYIYKSYGYNLLSKLISFIPPILYSWLPDSVTNTFNSLIDAINYKLLTFNFR